MRAREYANQEKITAFPTPRSGEAMIGILARGYARYGVDISSYMRVLVGKIRSAGTLDPAIPTYAARIASVMPQGHPLSNLDYMLCHHTAIPYYLFFAHSTRRTRVFKMLADPQQSALDMALGLSTARLDPLDQPRLCTRCALRDKEQGRRSSYAIEHQLPTSWICIEHDAVLTEGCATCHPRAHLPGYMLRMPDFCLGLSDHQPQACAQLDDEELEDARWFARQGRTMMERFKDVPIDPLGKLRAAVLQKFPRNRGIDSRGLAEAIERRFSPSMLDRLRLSFTSDHERSAGWHRQLLAPTTRCRLKETAQCLVILGAVCRDVDHFLDEDFSAALAPMPKDPEWRSRVLDSLAEHDGSFEAVRRELGITFGQLWKTMIEKNWTVPKPIDTGVSEAIYRQLLEAWERGDDQVQIATSFGVSDYFLQKMTLWEPGLRQRWLQARRDPALDNHRQTLREYRIAHPNAGRNAARSACDAAFRAVYKGDRAWIEAHFSKRHGNFRNPDGSRRLRKDWEKRDACTAAGIAAWARETLESEDRPEHLTATLLLRAQGAVHHHALFSERFPETREQLNRFVETKESYLLRRLRWAAQKCAKSGAPLKADAIRLVAALGRPHVDRYWSQIVEAYDAAGGMSFERANAIG